MDSDRNRLWKRLHCERIQRIVSNDYNVFDW